MARQDNDGSVDPALAAAWRRLLWMMRGSADVVEALVPTAAGMTKDEISRLLARAGAPSGKGVEPVEQVLGLLGVVPRSRYEALAEEYDVLLKEYEQLGNRVGEAEQKIEHLRRVLREQGLVDEAEQLLDSWGGLVRRTLRAQAGFVRSIAGAGANGDAAAEASGVDTADAVPADAPEPGPEVPAATGPEKKGTRSRSRTNGSGPGATPSGKARGQTG